MQSHIQGPCSLDGCPQLHPEVPLVAHFRKKEPRPLAILGSVTPGDGVEVGREGNREASMQRNGGGGI